MKKNIISIFVGFAVLIVMLLQVDINKIYSAILNSSPIWITIYFLLMVPFFILRAWRWRMLLSPIKKYVKFSSSFWITMIGFMVNTLIPLRLGGEFVRAFAMDGKEKTGFLGALSSVAVERVLDLFGIVLLSLIGIFILPQNIPIPYVFLDSLKIIGILVIIALLVLIIGTKYDNSFLNLIKRFIFAIPKLPSKWQNQIINFAKSIIDGAKGLSQNSSALIITITSTIMIWSMASLSTFLIFKAFNYEVPITIILLGSMLVQLSFILPAPPGYVGTYEAFWMAIFLGLGLSDINLIFTTSIVSHVLSNIFILTTGSLGVASMGLSLDKLMKLKSK